MSVATATVIPAFVRGDTIEDDLVSFGARDGATTFSAPDPAGLVPRLPLRDPTQLRDVHDIGFDEIVNFLDALGQRLALGSNVLLQDALAHSLPFSDMTEPLLRGSFEQIAGLFAAGAVREMAELTIGIPYLEGWVDHELRDGRRAAIRAFGARTVHVVAGNSPLISA